MLKRAKNRTGKFKNSLALFILITISILFTNCKKEFELYRFIDHLNKKNITSSPLVNLEQKFTKVEETWTGKEMFLMKSDKEELWAIPTQFPILGETDQTKPEGMQVFRNGEEIEFLNGVQNNSLGWKWKRIEEFIAPERYKGYKIIAGGAIILNKNEYFISQEFLLPQGEATFEIIARSQNEKKYLLNLDIYLNNERIGEIPILSYKNYKFFHKVESGKYRLKIGFQKVTGLSSYEEKEELLLDQIKISTSKDFILISSPSENRKEISKNIYKASYYSVPTSRIIYQDDYNRPYPGTISSNSLKLKNEASIEKEVQLLSSGYNVFEITCYSINSATSLRIRLGDRIIGQQRIIPWLWHTYNFGASVSEGTHDLKIEALNQENKSNSIVNQGQVIIHRISINDHQINTLLPLYKIKKAYPIFDLGTGKNPYSIKKKLEIGDQTINGIFAPTPSEFSFRLKIPEAGILEFGYGLLETSSRNDDDSVNFRITLEHFKDRKILFSQYLASSQKMNLGEILEETIDLSDYQGKNVKITFSTERFSADGKPEKTQIGLDHSFWFNPVIYKNSVRKENRGQDKPNIILISIDTLRADHLGCYGYPRKTSPNIDTLANDGVLFTNVFTATPITLPSHMSMLTSLYPINHKICTSPLGGPLGGSQKLDPSIVTLCELLRKENYFTTAFTGGMQVSSYFGFAKGFDYYQENKHHIIEDTAEILSKKASNWVNNNKNKNFFLFLHTYQVHSPYSPPPPYDQIFLNENAKWKSADLTMILAERQGYYSKLTDDERENLISLYDGGIKYTDEYFIGPFIEELKKLNLYDKTMIIFTSDHGEEFYEHKGWDHGHSLYTEQIKIPLIIKFPYSRFKGKRVKDIARIVDIMPTILKEAEVNIQNLNSDGKSLIQVINGNEKEKKSALGFIFYVPFSDSSEGSFNYSLLKISVIKENHKLILNENIRTTPFPLDRIELYNIARDPAENNNVADHEREAVQELMELINPFYLQSKEIGLNNKTGKAMIDKELEEKLRALGYIK